MITRKSNATGLSSAALAAVLFWVIYVAEAGAVLSAYWLGESRLALTALLALPFWLASLGLWSWRVSEEDDKRMSEILAKPRVGYHDTQLMQKTELKKLHQRRLRRRRHVALPIVGALVIAAFVLWAIAIWQDHGGAYAVTAVLLVACSVPLVGAMLEDD